MSLASEFMPQLSVNRARKREWPYGNIEGNLRARWLISPTDHSFQTLRYKDSASAKVQFTKKLIVPNRTYRAYRHVNDPIMPLASGCKPYPTVYTCRRLMMQCRRLKPPLIRLHTYLHHPTIATPPQVDYNMYS
jgi:hypothetical protein